MNQSKPEVNTRATCSGCKARQKVCTEASCNWFGFTSDFSRNVVLNANQSPFRDAWKLLYTKNLIFILYPGNNCKFNKAGSEERHSSFLDSLTWGSFGKLMALTITFAICSALTVRKCNTDYRWRSLTNLFFSIRELSKRQMPGLYLLYFFRR